MPVYKASTAMTLSQRSGGSAVCNRTRKPPLGTSIVELSISIQARHFRCITSGDRLCFKPRLQLSSSYPSYPSFPKVCQGMRGFSPALSAPAAAAMASHGEDWRGRYPGSAMKARYARNWANLSRGPRKLVLKTSEQLSNDETQNSTSQ